MSIKLDFVGKQEAFAKAHTSPPPLPLGLEKKDLEEGDVFLRGDNFEGLKLLHSLGKKFHFIYIDPPYNSGQKFSFEDFQKEEGKRSHAAWLAMMAPRLLLTKDILLPQGIFFISIDEREYSYLTVLVHEIFGRENHIGTIKWRKKRKPSFLSKHLSQTIEYILVIAKDHTKLPRLLGKQNTEKTRPVLNATNPLSTRILRPGTKAFCADGSYPPAVYKNRSLSIELLETAQIKNGALINEVGVRGHFRVNQEMLDKSLFITKSFGLRRYVDEQERNLVRHATDDGTIDWPTNEDAQAELQEIFQADLFPFAKPVGLILKLLAMYSSLDTTISCLDYFAGSGTLAHAVYLKNQEEGYRKYNFCCIQDESPLLTAAKSQSKLGLKTNADVTAFRIQTVEKRFKNLSHCKIYSLRMPS